MLSVPHLKSQVEDILCDCACVCPFPPDMVCEPRHLYKNPFVTWGTHKAASTTSIDVGTVGVMGRVSVA